MTFAEAVEAALAALGKAGAVQQAVEPSVATVAADYAALMRARGVEDVRHLFNGDPEHDRAVMTGAVLANEINSAIDWGAVSGEVLKTGLTVLRVALAVVSILA